MFPLPPLLHLHRPPSSSSFHHLLSISPPYGRLYRRHRTDPRAQLLPQHPEVSRSHRLARNRLQPGPRLDPAAMPRYMFRRPRDWVAKSGVKRLENKLPAVMSPLRVFLPFRGTLPNPFGCSVLFFL
ncbi:hypothetical protein RHGRI_016255 [Rhododendron griersonianum]|uniref:Uncharacterized protein n=1 Tax=Rhododendron griersonianum TaxID=479676 RepID=A0AAV6JTK2_9ERIC|nr:hypothetical protein RHGRI_016255 [Rhododendron griersonianum]